MKRSRASRRKMSATVTFYGKMLEVSCFVRHGGVKNMGQKER